MSLGLFPRALRRGLLPAVILVHGGRLCAAPYSHAANDPANVWDAPVPGFTGPDGEGQARLFDHFDETTGDPVYTNPRNAVNPLFFGWARGWTDYVRADGQTLYNDPAFALGPVTGDVFDVVSLGDLTAVQIASGAPVGRVTLNVTDALHPAPIRNLPGADFVVFENGVISEFGTGGAGAGGIFGELAYVEVSSDGVNFARFPSVSLTPGNVTTNETLHRYDTLDPTNIFNLAGKHVNAAGESWGTPFDLAALASHPLVSAGTLDLSAVRYLRLVDIPGNGSYLDGAAPTPHPIYDPWRTFGPGGFDLEAVGVISVSITFDAWQDLHGLSGAQRGPQADPDGDGVPNAIEYAFAMLPLTPDAELMPSPVSGAPAFSISFRRDTRPTDLSVEVLGASAPGQPWQVIARATAGGPLLTVGPMAVVIEDASDSPIASVGVIRRHHVHALPGQQFLKIAVTLAP